MLMEWPISVTKIPVPNAVECFGKDLLSMLVASLLVSDPTRRRAPVESLNHPCVRCARLRRSPTSPLRIRGGRARAREARAEGCQRPL